MIHNKKKKSLIWMLIIIVPVHQACCGSLTTNQKVQSISVIFLRTKIYVNPNNNHVGYKSKNFHLIFITDPLFQSKMFKTPACVFVCACCELYYQCGIKMNCWLKRTQHGARTLACVVACSLCMCLHICMCCFRCSFLIIFPSRVSHAMHSKQTKAIYFIWDLWIKQSPWRQAQPWKREAVTESNRWFGVGGERREREQKG